MTTQHTYKPPVETRELSGDLVKYFDGSDLKGRIGEAVCLTTVDEDGWPRAALLSVGEILAVDARHLRFAISPDSHTAKNIRRTGNVTFGIGHAGSLWDIRLSATPIAEMSGTHNAAIFAAELLSARLHAVPYAEVLTGITYRLKSPETVLERWQRQIEALRATV